MKKQATLVLIGIVLGAAGGALATGRVRAQPSAPTTAPRWEQDCAEARGVDEARTLARSRAEAGWEIVAFDAGVMCFKRPAPQPSRAVDPWPGY
ncbi:MAG: hypothetical protein IT372_20430 [Polyangiaceae bacterium]|nr:hypothetical protein [Polyangiaceae bacterium]